MDVGLSKRISMSSIRVWPDLANMPGVDAPPVVHEEEASPEPALSGNAVSDEIGAGSSAEVPAAQPGPESGSPEVEAAPLEEAKDVEDQPEAPAVEASSQAQAASEAASSEELQILEEAPPHLSPEHFSEEMPTAGEQPPACIDDTLELMLEMSEESQPVGQPGPQKEHIFEESFPPPSEVPIAPEPSKTAELATDVVEPAEVAMDNFEAVAEPVVDAEAPDAEKVDPEVVHTPPRAPTPKQSPTQSGAKRARFEPNPNPFYAPLGSLRPPTIAQVSRPPAPKRVKMPPVLTRQDNAMEPALATQGKIFRHAVGLVLEELFRRVKPQLVPQVPKIMERNRCSEINLLHEAIHKYVQGGDLPVVSAKGESKSLSQAGLLQEILEKLQQRLGVDTCHAQRVVEDADGLKNDFFQCLYALITAKDQERNDHDLQPGLQPEPSASSQAPGPTQPTELNEDPETSEMTMRLERIERRLAWRAHYARLEKGQGSPNEPNDLPKQDIEMFE